MDNIKNQKAESATQKTSSIQKIEQMSQVGKSPEEILPYLLSGESDDLSDNFLDKL